jgi:hypothetical protein
MSEKRGWLEKVLHDVNADVETWPSWLKGDEPKQCAQGESGDDTQECRTDESPERRFAKGA